MSWGLVIGAGVSAVAGYAKSRSEKKKLEEQREHDAAMTEEEHWRAMQRDQHSAALSDFYSRRDRAEAQRGLDEFRKFSTVQDFAPGYVNDNPRVEQPIMPALADYGAAPNAPEEPGAPSPSKKRNIHKKLADPLGLF